MSRDLPVPSPEIQELILNHRLKIQLMDTRGQGEAYEGVPRNSLLVAVFNPGSDQWFYEPYTDRVVGSKPIALENAVLRAVGLETLSASDELDTQIMDQTVPMPLMDESGGKPDDPEYLDNDFRF